MKKGYRLWFSVGVFNMMRVVSIFTIIPLITLVACASGPDFRKPEPLVPQAWSGPAPPRPAAASPAENIAAWWSAFSDPGLSSLIERAISSNLDLKIAEARIRQAVAARTGTASGLYPALDAGGAARRAGSGRSSAAGQYQIGLDAEWQPDIAGGGRRGVEAADAGVASAIESRRDVQVRLAALVARNYIDLRTFQERIAVAEKNLAAQRHSLRLTRLRFEGGFASRLDVVNAEAQAATTASQIPLLEAAVNQTIHGLGVLLGQVPDKLLQELSPAGTIPGAPPSVPVGVPSELLLRRPDIRQAEADWHAATARIGVATADLFPRFSITGSSGFQAATLGALFDPVGFLWSVGASAGMRVLDAGRLRSNITQQEALAEQAGAAYQQTVLTALREVEDALIASAKEEKHRASVIEAAAANRKAVELALKLYAEGETDFLNVLQAQRALYSSEDALIQSTRSISSNLVALYSALGGGWEG
jgi:NodT family efflux transporter outer membrane factor (OMF) lipoprotein